MNYYEITKDEYNFIIERRKLNEYNLFNIEYGYRHFNDMDPTLQDYDRLIDLKVKELDDLEEMIDAVMTDDLETVKNIFERDNVKIPFYIEHSSYTRQTGYGYELKYERALELACELNREEIVKYLYDNNVCCDNIMYRVHGAKNTELMGYIREKEKTNEDAWKINEVKHYKSVPVKDKRSIHDADYTYNQINMYKAVLQNNLEGVKYIFKRSKETPRIVEGYGERSYDPTYSLCVLAAAKLGHLEILKYLMDNKVAYEHLRLLNEVSPDYVPKKFEYQETEYSNEIVLRPDIVYTPVEIFLVNYGVYYDTYKSKGKSYDSVIKENEKEKILLKINDIFLKYSTDELQNNVDKLMKAIEDNDMSSVKDILSIGPSTAIYVDSYWNDYLLKFKKCYEKSVELKKIDVFKCFLEHGISSTGVKLDGEFEEIFEKHKNKRNLLR